MINLSNFSISVLKPSWFYFLLSFWNPKIKYFLGETGFLDNQTLKPYLPYFAIMLNNTVQIFFCWFHITSLTFFCNWRCIDRLRRHVSRRWRRRPIIATQRTVTSRSWKVVTRRRAACRHNGVALVNSVVTRVWRTTVVNIVVANLVRQSGNRSVFRHAWRTSGKIIVIVRRRSRDGRSVAVEWRWWQKVLVSTRSVGEF